MHSAMVIAALLLNLHLGYASLSAQAWQRLDLQESPWPEQSLPELSNTSNAAVCIAGGGTRAFVAGGGLLRALLEAKLWWRVRYLFGVSGGSWIGTTFTYRSGNISDEEFLGGNLTQPQNLSLTQLEQMSPQCSRWAATQSPILQGIKYFAVPTYQPACRNTE